MVAAEFLRASWWDCRAVMDLIDKAKKRRLGALTRFSWPGGDLHGRRRRFYRLGGAAANAGIAVPVCEAGGGTQVMAANPRLCLARDAVA